MKNLFLILGMILMCKTNAQEKSFIHPTLDPHWKLVVNSTFDSIIDENVWNSNVPWGPTDTVGSCDSGVYYTNYDVYAATTKEFKNLSIDTGVLNIQTRREQYKGEVWRYEPYFHIDSVDFNYTTGLLFSDSLYKYGYYEIKCQLPEAPTNDLDKYKGIGPNFWLWSSDGDSTGTTRYSEIDIFEILSHNPYDTDGKPNNYFTHNFHFLCDTLPDCPQDSFFHGEFGTLHQNINFDGFKTFASYWSENSIDYYYENSLLNSSFNFPEVIIDTTQKIKNDETYVNNYKFRHSNKLYPMYIIADVFVPGRQFCLAHDSSNAMPYNYLIDHIKAWQLKSECDSNLTIADIDPAAYDYTVKQSIELGSGGGDLNNGEALILRANQEITLQAGYEASLGSELTLIISDCMEGAGVFDPATDPGGTNGLLQSPIKYPHKPLKYQ